MKKGLLRFTFPQRSYVVFCLSCCETSSRRVLCTTFRLRTMHSHSPNPHFKGLGIQLDMTPQTESERNRVARFAM